LNSSEALPFFFYEKRFLTFFDFLQLILIQEQLGDLCNYRIHAHLQFHPERAVKLGWFHLFLYLHHGPPNCTPMANEEFSLCVFTKV